MRRRRRSFGNSTSNSAIAIFVGLLVAAILYSMIIGGNSISSENNSGKSSPVPAVIKSEVNISE